MTAFNPTDSWTDEAIVEELCNIYSGLSESEVEFIESVARRV